MTHIIGVDCASQDRKCGLALGYIEDGRVHVSEVLTKQPKIVPILLEWIRAHSPVLIAIDAPLGWPRPLGPALASHKAGAAITHGADELFHRATDRFVRERTGKRPMEVGADKIARAALRAVNLIQELRDGTALDVPLAWAPGRLTQPSAIEVYPALTLRSRNVPDVGYKGTKPEASLQRERIAERLEAYVALEDFEASVVASDDALDATLCLLAAADFLSGHVEHPTHLEQAQHEGWIWFQAPNGRDA